MLNKFDLEKPFPKSLVNALDKSNIKDLAVASPSSFPEMIFPICQ